MRSFLRVSQRITRGVSLVTYVPVGRRTNRLVAMVTDVIAVLMMLAAGYLLFAYLEFIPS